MLRRLLYVMPKVGFKGAFSWECIWAGYLHAWVKAQGWEGEAKLLNALPRWDASDDEILREGATSDLVGFFATSPQYKHALALARAIKEENPSTLAAIGGAHASAVPEDLLADKSWD